MKLKQKVDMTIDAILIIIGIVMLILPTFKVTNIKHLFFTIMLLYAILNFIQFILIRKSKDYEGLYTTIISLGIAITGLFFSFEDPLELAISLLSWTTLMGVAKLIKASYYNDKRDRMYKLRIFTLIAFLILGFLTSINLYYDAEIQVVVLGFFFYTHGILELIDPLVKYLLK